MTRALSAIATLIALGMASLGIAGAAFAQSSPARVVLITEAEANLPPQPDVALATRAGVTRGPKVVLVSPAANASVKSPLNLRLKFETFGGATIDPSSVRVTYLKNPTVDLTARVGPITPAGGIDLAAAEIPPGLHHIRVNVKDSEGRAGGTSFALKVLP